MILLNTTFSVDSDCVDIFTEFVKNEYAPAAAQAGLSRLSLVNIRMRPELNILTGKHASCYALQVFAPSQLVADKFTGGCESELVAALIEKCGNGVSHFQTVMDVVWQND